MDFGNTNKMNKRHASYYVKKFYMNKKENN